jgi:hypothetical protein
MNAKLDKFTAARIRRFTATGMAVQKGLPFERPRFEKPQMMSAQLQTAPKVVSRQQQAS